MSTTPFRSPACVFQPQRDPLMVVIFGRPGAGKSTVAHAALELAQQRGIQCLGLDLDSCVPQWMRDNFANGELLSSGQQLSHS